MTESDARWFLERGRAQAFQGEWYIEQSDGEWARVTPEDADLLSRLFHQESRP